ncbi:hypothetical protein MTR67_030699, partial [Solanum verrucosum]
RIIHDTHLFVVLFGTVDPQQYYPNYCRPIDASSISHELPSRCYEDLPLQAIRRARPLSVGTLSPTGTSPQLSAVRIGDSSSKQSDVMAGTPPLTQRFVHPDVSPSSTSTPSATPDDTMPALAPGQRDRLGRVMIEPDGSSWNPAKDAARALKDCVRRLYTHAYHSWSEIPNNKFKAISDQAKKARGSLKGGSLHTGGAKTVGTIAREMEKELGCTPIEPEVFKKTHVRKKETESDLDVWVEERAERTFNDFHQYVAENLDSSVQLKPELSTQIWKEKVSGLEGIGSSRQAEVLDGVQIAAMSDQIAKLTATLVESERRRVAEQESMSETIQQIKEQVMNLARRPTTSAPDDTDDESDENDYVDLTP